MTTPMGLDMAKAKAYAMHDKRGRSGIIRRRAIPIAIAAKILCKLTVHRTLQASPAVSAGVHIPNHRKARQFLKDKHSLKIKQYNYYKIKLKKNGCKL